LGLRKSARDLVLSAASTLRLHEFALALENKSRIVVVGMHETLHAHADELRRQLNWVAQHFTPITPEIFAASLAAKTPTWPGDKPAALFTFDDGRECNDLVAAPILESYGCRGIFFVVAGFVGLQGDAAKNYYYSKIDIRNLPPAQAAQEEIWNPMTPEHLADLSRRGHWIGNHTLSHANLAELSADELQVEIQQSAHQIALWIGRPADAFAWTYSWDAIDRNSWEAIRQVHRFCFSPCPGTVDPARDSPSLIWRKEIESYYPAVEYRFMYSGLVDRLWAAKRRKLRRMLSTF
jgi:peptidoglycan/xylan/chitin deacetylase (PgdA/CDA1 family)